MLLILALNVHWAWSQFSRQLPEWAKPDSNSLVAELHHDPVWLVLVQAVKITPDADPRWKGELRIATVKIVHVYTGPAKIENTTFEVASTTLASPNGIKSLNLKLNEQGIYCVRPIEQHTAPRETTDDPLVDNTISPSYDYNFPVQQRDTLFSQALIHSQSIERVAKADRNGQIRLLEMDTKSPIPQLSEWAIRTLAVSGVESAPDFLRSLVADPKFPVAGQLALDKYLAELDKTQWSDSPARLELWHRLVVAPADENDAVSIVVGIIEIARNESQRREKLGIQSDITPTISGDALFEWLRLAADNPKWRPAPRTRAVYEVGELVQLKFVERETAFAYLLARLQALPELTPGAPITIATRDKLDWSMGPIYGLQALKPLTDAEAAQLRELQTRAKPTYLQRAFDRLFEQTDADAQS